MFTSVFTFGQAQELARQFFARKTRELAGHDAPKDGPFTVETAVRDYLAHRRQRGSKGIEADAKRGQPGQSRGKAQIGQPAVFETKCRQVRQPR